MIREYRATDVDEVIAAWEAASRLAHPFLSDSFMAQEKTNIRDIYLPNTETWVYERDGRVIGFIALIVPGPGEVEVGAIFLDPGAHGEGIGKALMDHAVARHGALEVDVFEENKIGRRFYDRYGFTLSHRHQHDETGQTLLRLTYRA